MLLLGNMCLRVGCMLVRNLLTLFQLESSGKKETSVEKMPALGLSCESLGAFSN